MNQMFFSEDVSRLLRDSLREDIGTGDITTLSVIDRTRQGYGRYVAKEDGILCGMDVVEAVFHMLDDSVVLTRHFEDGASFRRGDVLAEVRGNAVSILSGERVGLNLLQHLSGIATRTREAVDTVSGTSAHIVDTRKTTPGMRVLEKYAVRVGGGSNHRFNLADGVLIKDNHIVAAGSITAAVAAAKRHAPHTLKIEVETETMEQVDEALCAGADNMDNDTMRAAVAKIAGRALTEASGNMGERDLRAVAETGVDMISIGALTHSVHAMDISLKFAIE